MSFKYYNKREVFLESMNRINQKNYQRHLHSASDRNNFFERMKCMSWLHRISFQSDWNRTGNLICRFGGLFLGYLECTVIFINSYNIGEIYDRHFRLIDLHNLLNICNDRYVYSCFLKVSWFLFSYEWRVNACF